MIVAVHQPNYFPWLGFFRKMAACDVFVLLDNVQYPRRGFCNRTRVKSPQGEAVWLTVPVIKGKYTQQINEVKLFEPAQNLKRQSLLLRHFYGRTPYYSLLAERLETILTGTWLELVSLNIELIKALANLLGISTPILTASSLGGVDRAKSERIITICRELGADTYLSGQGAKAYNDPQAFNAVGIKLLYQNFFSPEYPQGDGLFIAGLSALDLIAHTGLSGQKYVCTGLY